MRTEPMDHFKGEESAVTKMFATTASVMNRSQEYRSTKNLGAGDANWRDLLERFHELLRAVPFKKANWP